MKRFQQEEISLKNASKLVGYTSEYLTLLARQGKIKARKIGRDWIIEKNTVLRFFDGRSKWQKQATLKKPLQPDSSLGMLIGTAFASLFATSRRAVRMIVIVSIAGSIILSFILPSFFNAYQATEASLSASLLPSSEGKTNTTPFSLQKILLSSQESNIEDQIFSNHPTKLTGEIHPSTAALTSVLASINQTLKEKALQSLATSLLSDRGIPENISSNHFQLSLTNLVQPTHSSQQNYFILFGTCDNCFAQLTAEKISGLRPDSTNYFLVKTAAEGTISPLTVNATTPTMILLNLGSKDAAKGTTYVKNEVNTELLKELLQQ